MKEKAQQEQATCALLFYERFAMQKGFFSFQWQQALRHTNALLDGSEDPAILDGAGVTDEWKNHTDLEPFYAA